MGKQSIKDEVCILHLSDIHFSNAEILEEKKRSRILNSLITTIKKISRENQIWKPNVIAISGDVTFKGSEHEYQHAEKWINNLLEATKLKNSDVFICPGNHDIRRNVIRRETKKCLHPHKLSEYAKEKITIKRQAIQDFSHNAFQHFHNFCLKNKFNDFDCLEELKGQYLIGSKLHQPTGVRFNILNSAWLCRGLSPLGKGVDKGPYDNGNLYLSKPLVETLFQEIKDKRKRGSELEKTPSVTLVHHPPDWLHWSERYRNSPKSYPAYEIVADYSDIILSGHEHALGKRPDIVYNQAQLIISGASYYKEVADGKVLSKYNYNSFNLLKLNKTDATLQKREFYYNLNNTFKELWDEFELQSNQNTYPFQGTSINELNAIIAKNKVEIANNKVEITKMREDFTKEIKSIMDMINEGSGEDDRYNKDDFKPK